MVHAAYQWLHHQPIRLLYDMFKRVRFVRPASASNGPVYWQYDEFLMIKMKCYFMHRLMKSQSWQGWRLLICDYFWILWITHIDDSAMTQSTLTIIILMSMVITTRAKMISSDDQKKQSGKEYWSYKIMT